MRRMQAMSVSSKLVSTVHDSIVADCPEDEWRLIARTMLEVFNDIPKNVEKLFGIKLPLQFPGEVSYGPNLRDMQELTNS